MIQPPRRRKSIELALASLPIVIAALLISRMGAQSEESIPRIVVDPRTTYQTMIGWEAVAQAGQEDSPAFPAYRDQLFDMAVDDLGIDRLRVPVRSGIENTRDHWAEMRAGRYDYPTWRDYRFATVNDNSDPFRLNERGFQWGSLDDTIEQVVLPMQLRLAARGRTLFVNVNYHAFTKTVGPGLRYDHGNAEEYAEFVQATFLHLREKYGLTPDSFEIQLEPDNSPQWTGAFMRQAMLAAGNRLAAMGITPRFTAPSTTNMANALRWADAIAQNGPPRFWSELSYHRYGGVSDANLRGLASRAAQWNLTTGMLEHMGSGYEDLHADLKIGMNSAWQQFALAYRGTNDPGGKYYLIDDSNPSAPRILLGSRTVYLRQYFRYIRSGAKRIEATSTGGAVDPVAFVNTNGAHVVVVKAARGVNFSIAGLPAGRYEVTYTTPRDVDKHAGVFDVRPGGSVDLRIPEKGVLTLFGT